MINAHTQPIDFVNTVLRLDNVHASTQCFVAGPQIDKATHRKTTQKPICMHFRSTDALHTHWTGDCSRGLGLNARSVIPIRTSQPSASPKESGKCVYVCRPVGRESKIPSCVCIPHTNDDWRVVLADCPHCAQHFVYTRRASASLSTYSQPSRQP